MHADRAVLHQPHPPQHTQHRALLNGVFTPKRLKENEDFMWALADRLIDEFIADGRCDFVQAYENVPA